VTSNSLVPGLADHLAARMAWDGQMWDAARNPSAPTDLYEPVPGHQGAHGEFDDRARSSSWELHITMSASSLATAATQVLARALRRFAADAPMRPGMRHN
jgi:hypothetical protein